MCTRLVGRMLTSLPGGSLVVIFYRVNLCHGLATSVVVKTMAEDTNLWHKISGIHPNPVDNGYFHKNSEVIHRFHEQYTTSQRLPG